MKCFMCGKGTTGNECYTVENPDRSVDIFCSEECVYKSVAPIPNVDFGHVPDIPSPCVKDCKMFNGYCRGCQRTLKEIRMWRKFSFDQRAQVMFNIAKRKKYDRWLKQLNTELEE